MTPPLKCCSSTNRLVPLIAILTVFATLTTTAEAGKVVMINWFSGVGSVAGEFIGPLVDPNNDNVAGDSPNRLLVTQKAYNAIGPVDLEFVVMDTGGTTEYTFEEGVSNMTGIPWSAYRMELGFGVGSSFVPSVAGDGLDFDALDFDAPPDFSGSGYFTTVSWGEDVIEASGGIFPNFGFPSPLYEFNIDVPDGISSFTIRQQPIAVPEPGALSLLFFSGVAVVCRVRRARRFDFTNPNSTPA